MLGDSGLAHAFENGLNPSEERRIVAPSDHVGVKAGDGESGVEREPGLDGGMRFVKPPELRQGGGQLEKC